MNKKWLPILIVTTFSLTACNESKQHQTPSDSTTAYKNLSIANLADIKADLDTLDQISNKNSQAILNAQDALKAARQNKEVDTIPALLEQLKTHSLAFNTALDATKFKSSEVAALSEKFKQVHLLGVELAQENTKSPPQMQRITALEAEISVIQQSSISEMRALQHMIYPQLNSEALNNTRQQVKSDPELNVTAHTPPHSTSHLSQDNAADIKYDLIVLGAVSQTAKKKAQDSFMGMQYAIDSGNRNALMTAVKQTTTRIHDLNQKYDAVTLKSAEVTAAREKLKEENNLQIEMGNIILSASPDRQRFAELNKKWENAQKMVEIEMEALRIKANTAS
ncbi:MAG: hypothetical protein H9L35_11100 [Acinetobacter sp.]|uniref:hypothetical protein n=1 Tax=Acinetobacter sp. TaxID=472 RepID=UPI0019C0503E|nr:hypothetical protein [Acinetobacter sp.]MBC6676731.1 hypothetical protein [Acinetobacter sp.]